MVQEAAVPMAIQDLQVNGRKVELYNKEGKRFKTYYVGGPSNDMEGTFMMMENSNNPYVTHLQFLDGFLTDRYLIAEEIGVIKPFLVTRVLISNHFRLIIQNNKVTHSN
jgi:hypothetical protein